MSIIGVGIDNVSISRFAESLARTPRLAEKLFTGAERAERSVESLAARFAAKEAAAKVLGAPGGLLWHDCCVEVAADGKPAFVATGTVAAAAASLGITRWHVSLTHDGDIASAVVIGES